MVVSTPVNVLVTSIIRNFSNHYIIKHFQMKTKWFSTNHEQPQVFALQFGLHKLRPHGHESIDVLIDIVADQLPPPCSPT